MNAADVVIVRFRGKKNYLSVWQEMKTFTDERTPLTFDEMWWLEHFPVFTQGQNGKPEHVGEIGHLPLIQTDRGGQVTYHGPGQLVIYTLLDLKRKQLNVRQMVTILEQSMIELLREMGVPAYSDCKAPGVYIAQQKIASVGLRVRRGCTFHGLALNVNMDLGPFSHIHPCGFPTLKMTQLSAFYPEATVEQTALKLIDHLTSALGYIKITHCNEHESKPLSHS